MTILECRSCFERWEPTFDPDWANPEVKIEFTFCRPCGDEDARDFEVPGEENEECAR